MIEISEYKPDDFLSIVAPKVSAESSITFKLYFFGIVEIFGQLGRLPIRFGTQIAEVFFVIFFSINSSSIFNVSFFISTNTGFS